MRALVLLVLLGGCSKETFKVQLESRCSGPDGGVASSCSDYKNDQISCVNFLRFIVQAEGSTDEVTRCVSVIELLGHRPQSFCELQNQAARGLELFDLKPDQRIRLSVRGLRVFPGDSCQGIDECNERLPIFEGQSELRRVEDLVGSALTIAVTRCGACGEPLSFFQNPGNEACEVVCRGIQTVCRVATGCLCRGRLDGGIGG